MKTVNITFQGETIFTSKLVDLDFQAVNNAGLINWNPEPTINWSDFRRFVDNRIDDIIDAELSAVEFE